MLELLEQEVLKMAWLQRLWGYLLSSFGLDLTTVWGRSLHFFLYDSSKILFLLLILIALITYLQTYVTAAKSRAILGRFRGPLARILAALLGTVTPFCSCSSIPLFIGFTRAGLPLGVSFAFLISSPMVDLASLFLLGSLFGLRVAALYVLAGLLLAVLGGSLIEHWHLESEVEGLARQGAVAQLRERRPSQRERWRKAWQQALKTAQRLCPFVLLGVGLGALIHNVLPEAWIVGSLGANNPFGVLLAVLLGVPLYADIFATAPIAEALLARGAQLGVALALMMAVTTLSLPSLVLLRQVVKPKLLTIFLIICTLGIMLIGYGCNFLASCLI